MFGSLTRQPKAILAIVLAFCLVVLCVGIPALNSPTSAETTTRKLHIHHGWDLSDPSQIALNKATIESRPMDGVTVILRGLSDQTFDPTHVHTQTEYATALAKMPVMTKVVHNFVIVRVMHPVSWTTDSQWTTISNNFKALAAATKAKGQFDGIFFDVEWYGSGTYPWNYPGAFGTNAPTLSSALVTVQNRAKQVAQAVGTAWPTAQFLTTYGPWVGTSKTVQSTGGGWNFGYNDTSATNELMGAFGGGIAWGLAAAGAGTAGGRYVDGGEVYQAHSSTEYAKVAAWQKNIATAGTGMIPSPTSYPGVLSRSFGVYDRDMRVSGWPLATASQWQTWMTNSLTASDKYVWSYSERYDWMNNGYPSTKVPAEILTATKNALAAANSGAAPAPSPTVSPKPSPTASTPSC